MLARRDPLRDAAAAISRMPADSAGEDTAPGSDEK